MAARIIIERILRDSDDASGQSVREWKIESEPGFLTIRGRDSSSFIMIRADDVNKFIVDIERAKGAAFDLSAGASSGGTHKND